MRNLRGSEILFCFLLFCSDTFPEVNLKECVLPFVPMNGSIHPLKKPYSLTDEIEHTCDKGFYLIGHRIRKCQTNGAWSHRMPFCDPLSEIEPPVIRNSSGEFQTNQLTDKKEGTCVIMENGSKCDIQLVSKANVSLIRLNLPEAAKCMLNVSASGMPCDETPEETSRRTQWKSYTCKDRMATRKFYVEIESHSCTEWKMCEVEVYTTKETSCNEPPGGYLPKMNFRIDRERALLICDDSKGIPELYFVCEAGKWKGVGTNQCRGSKTPYKLLIILAAVVPSILIVVTFVAGVFIYKRWRKLFAAAVLQNQSHADRPAATDSPSSIGGGRYADVIYEDAPLPPARKEIRNNVNINSSLPDVLAEYSSPTDNREHNRTVPENIRFYTLPQDSLPHGIHSPYPIS